MDIDDEPLQEARSQEVQVQNNEIMDESKENSAAENVQKKKTVNVNAVLNLVIPSLTLYNGKKKLTFRKSFLVISLLYASHSFSAWGDRMWSFAVSLLLLFLYPGSLLLPGLHGFLVQLTVALFGTAVGDWVDYNTRLKVAIISLLTQNGLLALSSVAMGLMFYFQLNVCLNVIAFGILTTVVIIFVSGANLATVANTISIEKDWVVALADGNKDTLAVLNSNMRRIDLCCKLLAPALTGVILQHTGPFYTTVLVAIWNIVSFFGELGLLWMVYKLIPTLAAKKLRKLASSVKMSEYTHDKDDQEENMISSEDEALISEDDDDKVIESSENDIKVKSTTSSLQYKGKNCCGKLLKFFYSFRDGLKIYVKQEIALVGFSMASIYLTVLGFSGVTASYLLTQDVRNDLIGVFQGIGAIFGVLGTILYPFLRKKVGTIRTGLFGISTQLLILSFCLAAVFVPSRRISSQATGYYSPDCSAYSLNNTDSYSDGSIPDSLFPSTCVTVSPTLLLPSPTVTSYHTTAITLSPTPVPSPSCQPYPPYTKPRINIAVILMLIGIIGCRIGLWTFDLAVQQLIQEKVVEEERGVVSGVMNAMNSVMDMLHYVLVIAAPRPEHFNILTVISVSMVAIGWLLYCIYVRKSRGHFFHCRDCYKRLTGRKQQLRLPVEEK